MDRKRPMELIGCNMVFWFIQSALIFERTNINDSLWCIIGQECRDEFNKLRIRSIWDDHTEYLSVFGRC